MVPLNFRSATLVFALILVSVATAATAQPQSPASDGRVIEGIGRVIDGDTIAVGSDHVRLFGIDAPERGVRCGTANGTMMRVYRPARIALTELVGDQPVRCVQRDVDKRGRPVAICSGGASRSTDLSLAMIQMGWAWDWPHYSGGRYAAAEQHARQERRGLWQLRCEPSALRSGRALN